MTAFTKDHPFEFEGVKVYLEPSWLCVNSGPDGPRLFTMREMRALRAFIEAESAEWWWVEEGKVARKGRFTVELVEAGGPRVCHDDWPNAAWYRGNSERQGPKDVLDSVWRSFDAWLAAQSQLAEPTTFGYVGTVTDKHGPRALIRTARDFLLLNEEDGDTEHVADWPSVLALGTFEPKGDGR